MVNDSTFTINILQIFWIGIYHLIYKKERISAPPLGLASRTPSIEYCNMVDQMLLNDQLIAKYNPEQNEVEIFNVDDLSAENTDMICLADMLNELVDEMIRRGYDPETIVFSMDKPFNSMKALKSLRH
jgi:hypothetical protein